jgi:hypothetical protein
MKSLIISVNLVINLNIEEYGISAGHLEEYT